MRINYLELRNYRRFKELKLQFPDGVVGILGLNGVGKTTIIEAIAWALFGNVDEAVRTSREGVRRSGAAPSDGCAVTLEFELGGDEYRIEREMSGKNLSMKAEITSKGKSIATGDKEVRKKVEKLMGMDHKSFFTSVFARQKELNALQSVAPNERKKVVLRMLRIDSVDDVLARIRADKKDASSRIEGAQRTLLAEDGREREALITERLPGLHEAVQKASEHLEDAEAHEREAAKAVDSVRKRRDELKKDVDAYNSEALDLKGKRSTLDELRKREQNIAKRHADANMKLKRLPELSALEERWRLTSEKREALEKDRGRNEKLKGARTEAEADEKEEASRLEELSKVQAQVSGSDDTVARIDEVERAKTECQTERATTSGAIGELMAKVRERKEAAAKDRKRLEEIIEAGKKGICPTCERTLEDAYDLIVKKLKDSSAEAERTASADSARIAELESKQAALEKKEEALRKKRAALDQQLTRRKQIEALLSSKESELAKLRSRLARRKAEIASLGEVSFSEDEYARITSEYQSLKATHDEYLELRQLQRQAAQLESDIEEARIRIKKVSMEEQQVAAIMKALEPKKAAYDTTIVELDQKTTALSAAKDALRKLASSRDKAAAELGGMKKELEGIARTKKALEEDRRKVDELGMLEDVVVNFKDYLMARVAPVLAELTSKGLESMTEGKYSRVELDENYEIHVEDQGVMYPISRFSGGESDLANLSLRLAISRIIADRTGAAPMNLLILDEIFGSQDPNRKRSVMSALSQLSSQFRQIFLITHIEDVKDSLNYIIRVEEAEDGTSTARLAA